VALLNHVMIPDWRPVRSSKASGTRKFLDSFADRRVETERSLLEDLVGEAAQNALDATLPNDKPVVLEIEIRNVAVEDPRWSSLVGTKNARVLRVSNRNAKGLDGAVSNGPPDGDYQRFMGFDSDSSKAKGAGSYGYGRSTYFTASRSHRILVDSVFRDANEQLIRRLVGVRLLTKDQLEQSKADDDRDHKAGKSIENYCDGVEVWGIEDPRGKIMPIEAHADDTVGVLANIANSMGLYRPAGDAEEGTDIYVLDMKLDNELCEPHEPESVAQHIRGALFWRLWPALQDGAVTAAVIDNGTRFELELKPDEPTFWPLLFFSQLRDHARGRQVVDKCELGGRDLQVYTPTSDAAGKVHAASYVLSRLNIPPDSCLRHAYPGNQFFDPDRNTGLVSVVRFRGPRNLVVNYEDHVHCKDMPHTSLKGPEAAYQWALGILEVADPELSERIRTGASDRNLRVEDVSHTVWTFPKRMRDYAAIADASRFLADSIGVVSNEPNALVDQKGASYWSRALGDHFPVRRGAPGSDPSGRGGGGGGGGGGGAGNGNAIVLRPNQPRVVNGTRSYIFDTENLEPNSTYAFVVRTQSVNEGDRSELAGAKGYVLTPTSEVIDLDLASYTHSLGNQISITMTGGATAVVLSAERSTASLNGVVQ
jgi:hypothetical protein